VDRLRRLRERETELAAVSAPDWPAATDGAFGVAARLFLDRLLLGVIDFRAFTDRDRDLRFLERDRRDTELAAVSATDWSAATDGALGVRARRLRDRRL